jgi:phosphatidylcholine synthase
MKPQLHPAQPFRGADGVNAVSAGRKLAAWSVHAYTASGAFLALLGVLAVFQGRYREAFLLMVLATLIDATDGLLARLARVKEATPGVDGAKLDDIVDYLTFTFLPVVLLVHAGDLPAGWGLAVAAVVLLSSAYGFAAADAKSADHYFTGFPSYWNIVALYLHAAGLPPAVNAAVLLGLCVMVFVRIGYIYPSRTPVLQGLTNTLGVIWAVLIVAIIYYLPEVPGALVLASLFYPVYYTVLSFVLHARRTAA